MRQPDDRDHRLDEAIYGHLRELADAEEIGADVAPIAGTVIRALSPLSPFCIEALERAYRSACYYASYKMPSEPAARIPGLSAFLRHHFRARPGPRPAPPRAPAPELKWIKILDSSGFVREAMLKAIDEPPPAPIFLAALLHGLNDHVPEVRAAANECFLRIGGMIATDVTVSVVPYLLRRPREWRHAENSNAVRALLGRPEVRASIKTILLSNREGWLVRFFRDVLASDIADAWLEELASQAAHPAIRARSIVVLTEGKASGLVAHRRRWSDPLRTPDRPVDLSFNVASLIAAGARDRTVVVRKAAAQALIRHYKSLPEAANLLAALGEESNAAVRDRLDFIRRKLAAG